MAKSKSQKQNEVASLKDRLERSKAVVLTSYSALTVDDMEALRAKFRAAGVEYQAAKKSLIELVLNEGNIEHDSVANIEGSVAVAFSTEDEVAAAKVAKDFSKGKDTFQLGAGLLKVGADWRWLTKEEVVALASLPSKEELLAKVVGTINAPISGFVNVLAGNIRGLVNVLNAVKETK
ncbi:MAG: 50S ribosomal protein L10 [Candidatus Komeilibacteria bacterium]|nr:50S ribosomal protein L10 [Candidatus Komeilibacteria bacterium]